MREFIRHINSFIAVGLCFSLSAAANEPSEKISAAMTKSILLSYGHGKSTLYPGIPPNFPVFDVPANVIVLGGVVNQGEMLASFSPQKKEVTTSDQLVNTMTQALSKHGWSQFKNNPFEAPGFFATRQRPKSTTLCHEQLGDVIMTSSLPSEEVPVVVLRYSNSEHSICKSSHSPESFPISLGLGEYLPALTLPSTAIIANPHHGSTQSSSNDSASSEVRFTLSEPQSLSDLSLHFSKQLRKLGWRPESSWHGVITEGSTWQITQTPAEQSNERILFVGTLKLIQLPNGAVSCDFSLVLLSREHHKKANQ